MSEKFKNKYRIASARAPFWDYGSNAAYFVTICTQNRVRYFGAVDGGEMVLSEIGQMAWDCWAEIPTHFPFVKLDEFVVMPNHVHGIIIIDKPGTDRDPDTVETQYFASLHDPVPDDPAPVPVPDDPVPDDIPKNRFGPQSQNLASIVRGFKIGVTKTARRIAPGFAWQPRFHDRIILDDRAFQNIARYIRDNPQNWDKDTFY
ncbi:MAG: transposase [Bacteroidia bacterium]|nr:transposase [Bacteroidia bacterium]